MADDIQDTILVIEDHREFQELITTLLEAEGFHVVTAGSGAAAMASLDAIRPTLILLDSSLPDSNGAQVARAIRARRVAAPIVLMTTELAGEAMGREIGAVQTLIKPFSTSALMTAVRGRLSRPTGSDINLHTGQMTGAESDMISNTRDLPEERPSQATASRPPVGQAPARQPQPIQHAPAPLTVQWEYCQMIAAGRSEIRGETFYSVDLVFMGETVTQRRIASREGPAAAPWTTNPWKQAIGLLGLAGWELVNIQHGDYAGRAAEGSTLSWNTVVAYFRRPVDPNRPITEPKISLTRS